MLTPSKISFSIPFVKVKYLIINMSTQATIERILAVRRQCQRDIFSKGITHELFVPNLV